MQWTQFQSQYPAIAGLLPSNFMKDADTENTLRLAIEQDRTPYLKILDRLARKTPAKVIRKDPNRLYGKTNFQSFYSEMRAFVAIQKWVFPNQPPQPADVKGTQGNPDFEYTNKKLDVEVASRTAWDKKDNVVIALKEKLEGTPYISEIKLLDDFIKVPYTGNQVDHNEKIVHDIIDKINNLNASNLPSSISNNGIEIEFKESGGSGSVITWDKAEKILLDPQGRVVDQIKDKVTKQRGSRPLLIFYDSSIPTLNLESLEQLTHGKRSSGQGIKVSEKVYQHKNVWGDYLRDQGYIPDSEKTTWMKKRKAPDSRYDIKTDNDSCIPNGDEGIFVDSIFDKVAGILFVDFTDHGYFLPNFYSQKMNFYPLHRNISNNMKSNDLSNLI